MSNFLLLAILFCILGVVIMIIYLADCIDRTHGKRVCGDMVYGS